ncbi:MAG: 1-(5-phosphoribosyl)-5-[(5-phosphoribosylamino)methylideneamino]imidazole-4-carboxamide isomerase [Tissierellales bacterium]
MIIYPAIDILKGKCVRLYKGDYDKVTQYFEDPLEVAISFKKAGASHIHVVDLDGAKSGNSENLEIIKSICEKSGLLVQTGGGIRSLERIDELVAAGVDRIILGTAAIKNPTLVKEAVKKYGDKIVVGIDALNDKVSVEGWTDTTDKDALETTLFMKSLGVKSIVYTDISKDGTLEGPNLKALKKMIEESGLDVVASGGIKDIDDIRAVNNLKAYAVISGKAIYEDKIDLKALFKEFEHKDKARRIIVCMDIKDMKVVKGVNFENIVEAGDPLEMAKKYDKQGADELYFLDISAKSEKREETLSLIEAIVKSISTPLTVGGGVDSLDYIERLLNIGVSKVSIGSGAINNPELIRAASETFGKDKIVLAVDVKKEESGKYYVYTQGGQKKTDLEALSWIKTCESLGAGEILLTSMDGDGTKNGYDLEITKQASKAVNIPVIASGGAGSLQDYLKVFTMTKAQGALAASLFHFDILSVKDIKTYLQKF